MFSDKILKAHHFWILSCSSPKAGAWLIVRLVFPTFRLFPLVFLHNISNTTWTTPSFNCRYPFMCVNTSHQPYWYPPLKLRSRQWAHGNPWCNSWHLCYHCTRCCFPHGTKITTYIFFSHIQLLSSTSRHCVHQRWYLHRSWHCHCRPNANKFTSSILRNIRIYYLRCGSSQKMELLWPTPHQSIPPFSNWIIWMLHKQANVFLHNCATTIWSLIGPKGPHLFVLITFLHKKI
jgi:hypothetical protein